MRLCAGRRRVAPAPTERKIRPGEPLPRGAFGEVCCVLTNSAALFPCEPAEETTATVPEQAQLVASPESIVCRCHAAACRGFKPISHHVGPPLAERTFTRAKRGETTSQTRRR